MDCNLVLFSIITLISYSTQTMTGFGSTILALALGIHFYPIDVLLPVLVSLDMVVNLYIVIRHHRHIRRSILSRKIIPAMGIGLLAGMAAFHFIQGVILEKIFGFLVTLLSARELYRLLYSKQVQTVFSKLQSIGCIIAAGFIHGIYASGGPLLTYSIGKLNLPKSVFRSTLGAVWLFFSIILIGIYLWSGKFTQGSIKLILILLPMVIAGIITGEWLHRYIDEYRFKLFVFVILLLAGLSIITL